jgi:hypothetical protein
VRGVAAVVAVISAVLLTVGCKSTSAPPDPLSGDYDAVSVNGRALPNTISADPCSRYFGRSTVLFPESRTAYTGRVTLSRFFDVTRCDSPGITRLVQILYTGEYVVKGDSIWFDLVGPDDLFELSMAGRLADDRASFEMEEHLSSTDTLRWVFRLRPGQ